MLSNEHIKLKLTEREIDLLVYLSNEDKEKVSIGSTKKCMETLKRSRNPYC